MASDELFFLSFEGFIFCHYLLSFKRKCMKIQRLLKRHTKTRLSTTSSSPNRRQGDDDVDGRRSGFWWCLFGCNIWNLLFFLIFSLSTLSFSTRKKRRWKEDDDKRERFTSLQKTFHGLTEKQNRKILADDVFILVSSVNSRIFSCFHVFLSVSWAAGPLLGTHLHSLSLSR